MGTESQEDAVRFMSPRLRTLPWTTNIVQRQQPFDTVFNANVSVFRGLFQNLQAYETRLLRSRHNTDEKTLDASTLALLGLQILPTVRREASVVQQVDAWNKETHDMTTHEATSFVSLLCAYRAVDVLAQVKRLAAPFARVLHPDRSIMVKPPRWFAQVEDVKSVLLDFRSAVQKHAESSAFPVNNPTSAIIGSIDDLRRMDKRTSIYRNLLHAALHLCVMARGKFSASQVPDLSSVEILDASQEEIVITMSGVPPQALVSGESSESNPSTNVVDTDSLRTHLQNVDLSLAKLPLQVALAVSAVYLLLPHDLQTAKFSRLALLKAYVAIGHGKDPRLLLLEDIIWRAVVGLVDGTIRPSQIGTYLLESIPWDVVEGLESSPASSPSLFFNSNINPVSTSQAVQSASAPTADMLHAASAASLQPSLTDSPAPSSPRATPSGSAIVTPMGDDGIPPSNEFPQSSPESATPLLAAAAVAPLRRSARAVKTSLTPEDSSSSFPSSTQTTTKPGKRKDTSAASALTSSKKARASKDQPLQEYRILPSRSIVKEYAALLGTSQYPFIIDDEPMVDSKDWNREYGATAVKLEVKAHVELGFRDSTTAIMWNCMRDEVEINLSFHMPEEDSLFRSLFDRSISKTSALTNIRLHKENSLATTSLRAIALVLSKSCLVISGMMWPPCGFRVQDLQFLLSLEAAVPITDFSVTSTGSTFSRNKYCSVVELLHEHEVESSNRRNLLAVDIPLLVNDAPFFEASTDIVAWVAVAGSVPDTPQPIPVNRLLSFEISTGNAILPLRIEIDGFARHIDIRTGSAALFVAAGMRHLDYFHQLLADPAKLASDQTIEHILLDEGCRAVIPPNTPFAICYIGPTIAKIGRFYNISCMQTTLRGVIHSFIGSPNTCGASRPESRLMLRKMMHFVHRSLVVKGVCSGMHSDHLPNLSPSTDRCVDMGEVLNFWILCVLNIIANVVDPRTYCVDYAKNAQSLSLSRNLFESRDVNNISEGEREEMCLARAVALDAFDWFRHCFETIPPSDAHPNLFDAALTHEIVFLVNTLRVVLAYTLRSDTSGIGAQDKTRCEDVESQVINLIGFRDDFQHAWDILETDCPWRSITTEGGGDSAIIHPAWMSCSVRRLERIRLPREVSSREGRTDFDELFRDWKRRKDTGTALLNTTFVL